MTYDHVPEHTSAVSALDGFSPLVCLCTKDPSEIHDGYFELQGLTPDEARSLATELIEAAGHAERQAARLLIDTMENLR
jgi:hypothetical protein